MAFDKLPPAFFGPTYSVVDGVIQLPTADTTAAMPVSDIFFQDEGDSEWSMQRVTTSFQIRIGGERVRFTAGTVAHPTAELPPNILPDTDYWVIDIGARMYVYDNAVLSGTPLAFSAAASYYGVMHLMGVVTEVSTEEADVATGDWRKVVAGLLEMMYRHYIGVPVDSRPGRLSISRSSTVNAATMEVTAIYTVRVTQPAPAFEVADEAPFPG